MKLALFLKNSLIFNRFYCFFLFRNKTLRLNNLKTRTDMNVKISVLVIYVEVVIYLWLYNLLLYNLHDCEVTLVSLPFYLCVRPSAVCLSVCLSVRWSVRPSLKLLKIGSLVSFNTVRDDSWPWYLALDKARCLKTFCGPKLGPNEPKLTPKLIFLSFSQVWFISFR